MQLSLTSFYHCQFQLSTLQRGKKLIVEQLFIYFCVFFSSLWIQLFFGQIFIDYILFSPKIFLSMWKWDIIIRNQLVKLKFFAKCVIWNITAQYQYCEFDKNVFEMFLPFHWIRFKVKLISRLFHHKHENVCVMICFSFVSSLNFKSFFDSL